MIYFIGNNLSLLESSAVDGYWMKGSNVFDVSTSTHIRFMIEHPEDFNLTLEDIRRTYKEFGEKIGKEGKAREKLIRDVSNDGWIRIRHYFSPKDYWSIQCDVIRKRRKQLQEFCFWAIEHKLMTYHDEVVIMGYNNTDDREYYDFSTGGVKKFLVEKKKRTNL